MGKFIDIWLHARCLCCFHSASLAVVVAVSFTVGDAVASCCCCCCFLFLFCSFFVAVAVAVAVVVVVVDFGMILTLLGWTEDSYFAAEAATGTRTAVATQQ